MKIHQMKKRIAVAAEAISNAADIEVPVVPKTDYAERLIGKAIEGNLLFEQLTLPAKQAIIRSMTPQAVRAGDVIIKQGDTDASKFYVLERGAADVLLFKEEWGEERAVHSYQPGSGFGELALLYSAPRAATVKATADGKLWVMERTVYAAIKRTDQQQVAAEKARLVEQVPLLAVLAPEHKQVVADALELVEFGAGEAVFGQGEAADRFYLLREGTVVMTRDGREVGRVREQAYFGEKALIDDAPRDATATADGYVVCYTLGRKAFHELLGPIEDVPILSNLSEQQLFQLARCMANRSFGAGEVVFRQGEAGDTFYVVEEGSFSITDGAGRELATCGRGNCFGELALLNNEARAATVQAATAAKALACTRADFDTHLGSLAEIRNMWRFEALRKASRAAAAAPRGVAAAGGSLRACHVAAAMATVPLLTALRPQQRLALCTAFGSRVVPAGQAVIRKGEEGDTFYIIEEGGCTVVGEEGQELAKLGPTAYFGERALLRNEPRAATVLAASGERGEAAAAAAAAAPLSRALSRSQPQCLACSSSRSLAGGPPARPVASP
ncbi:hypothetical protein CHLNCDRAFT_54794 [Chlorella variabilis]|uniref:Cyclic nucleotide-binding domain-containing protein n=1 Tax=Chlorella variabilis TaxID=554065 RepID=E1ZQI3_CHLVA|nr:hypothetical protein CHLNCDRAFT_54794 [Chlorella variabilis]EFN52025.1 hypothetical protein CHLNCDRAFT_54794 [Chlorella variabilis]|eukprot:XP_005844127.1 hypothetical protein CHLNCDRAFT_54794 [Chlorella variabilis]